MRNADLLPPVSSQLYNIGNHETIQMQNLDICSPMDNKLQIVNNPGFSMESQFSNDSDQVIRGASFANPFQSFQGCQPGFYQFPSSNYCDIMQQPMLLYNNVPAPHVESDFKAIQTRKRSVEFPHLLQTRCISNPIEGNKNTWNEWKRNKRKKISSFGQQRHNPDTESINVQDYMAQVPVRRSQKMSDKITTLQKLVSPYGKTDTASVLQEASLYIKLLQGQIQNMFQMLSSSHTTEFDGKVMDLQSRGFCLVPMSFTQELITQQDYVESNARSRDHFHSMARQH